MSSHIRGKYIAGVIHPDQPLDLPENSQVEFLVLSSGVRNGATARVAAPRFTAEQLRDRIASHSVSIGTLPVDFSRADIYQDHD
ncbi:MAG: hypothetical protein AB7O59_02580 [Pirellulales bacterium]